MSTFHVDGRLDVAVVTLPEAAAHHARVKRLVAGDAVSVTNGAGQVADGTIVKVAKTAVEVEVARVRELPRPSALALFVPVGDRDRMLWLAEKATELGVTAWQPVRFHRSRSVSPRGEGPAFTTKVRARMLSALEQSGGAWLPEIRPEIEVAEAVASGIGTRYLLDATGGRFDPGPAAAGASVILGPEGGIEPAEREALLGGGWRPVRLAATILRFETAALAAAAIVRAAHVPIHEDAHG